MNEDSQNLIKKVTRSFYEKAINDVFIGYHFRKITGNSGPISSIEEFEKHLEKINEFWQAQLLATKFSKGGAHLLNVHIPLSIRKGELGRWVILFKQTLDEFETVDSEFISMWRMKVDMFEKAFTKYFFEN